MHIKNIVRRPILPNLHLADTFSALRHDNYRLWFFGMLISVVGTWMQNTAQGYLVYDLTKSPAYLGYVGFVAGIPTWLFTLYGGIITDRVNRRTLLIITQSLMMVLAFVLAGLVFSGAVQPWHIVLLAFLLGTVNAFDMPARQAFVNELVPHEDLTNAIALNSTLFNAALIVGPAVSGFTYALVGPAWCFTINGITFIGVLAALFLMKLKPFVRTPHPNRVWVDLKEGLRYIRSDEVTIILLIGLIMFGVFGGGILTLLPAWAVNILGGDVKTNGWLYSFRGIGAVISGLMIAALGRRNVRGRIWTMGSFLLPTAMLVFAMVRTLPVSLLLMILIGWGFLSALNTSNAMIQTRSPDHLRGRGMGVFTLMLMGGLPLGSILAGSLADRFGEPATVILSALVLAAFAAVVFLWRPTLRRVG